MIIIGAEEHDDEDKSKKGLYLFESEEGTFTKDQRNYNLANATPRFVTSRNNQCYALTKGGISQLSINTKTQSIQLIDSVLFDELFSEIFTAGSEKDKDRNILLGRDDIAGSLVFTPNKELLVTLYLPENGRLDMEDSEVKLGKYGYLFYSHSGKLQDLKLNEEIEPSGKPTLGNNNIITPVGKRLEQMVIRESCCEWQRTLLELEHPTSVAAYLGGFTIGTSVAEGYAIHHQHKDSKIEARGYFQKGSPDFDPLFTPAADPAKSEYLSSEATSVAIIRYPRGRDYYALFGLDDGFIRIYKLQIDGANVAVEYANDFSLLSKDRAYFQEADRDNHVYNLVVRGDLVSFSLRNMYIQMSFQKMLNTTVRITAEDEKADKRDIVEPSKKISYLDKLRYTYGLTEVCMVPHRINSWCFLE